jgi:CubicO group peptidase (beta-lactamase class C family)
LDRRAFLTTAAACSIVSASTTQLARAQSRARFSTAASYSAQRDGASFIVVRHGIVLHEDYPDGGVSTRWPIGTGTRAFMPLLAASLIEDRLLNLDEPVSRTLAEWSLHPQKSIISMRLLLSGVSGLRFDRRDTHDLATALSLEPRDDAGARFSDDAAPYLIFCEAARRKLQAAGRDSDPAQYLTTRTLLPIGCVPIGWARASDGQARFDDGAAVSARGWAAAGELIRREGVWRAQQLCDDAALREAASGPIGDVRIGFGLLLAGSGRTRGDVETDTDIWRASSVPFDLAMGAGQGGQRLYLSPSQGLVVVRQSRSLDASSWSDAQFLSLLLRDL